MQECRSTPTKSRYSMSQTSSARTHCACIATSGETPVKGEVDWGRYRRVYEDDE
jgi:hypothetical protein